MIDELTEKIEQACEKLFGDPVVVIHDFDAQADMEQWVIYTRLFGRRARFDIELETELVDNLFALQIAMHNLANQIMDQHEEELLRGYTAYFDIDRAYTTGIIRYCEPYKLEKWRKAPTPGQNSFDTRIGL